MDMVTKQLINKHVNLISHKLSTTLEVLIQMKN